MNIITAMAVDMVEFNRLEVIEEDYILEDFFPKSISPHLHPLIEHRIKLLIKENTIFPPGETITVNTCCIIKGKLKSRRGKLSMHIIPYENLPLNVESAGYIDGNFQGRIVVQLTNYSCEKKRLCSRTPVGYIVMQPYSME